MDVRIKSFRNQLPYASWSVLPGHVPQACSDVPSRVSPAYSNNSAVCSNPLSVCAALASRPLQSAVCSCSFLTSTPSCSPSTPSSEASAGCSSSSTSCSCRFPIGISAGAAQCSVSSGFPKVLHAGGQSRVAGGGAAPTPPQPQRSLELQVQQHDEEIFLLYRGMPCCEGIGGVDGEGQRT